MKFTTSNHDSIKADIRAHFELYNIFKYKACFIGIHLDVSMHQIIIYFGFAYLFIEIYGVNRSSWGEATIDQTTKLFKLREWTLQKHDTNHIPDYFFNLGITITDEGITFFFWKLELWSKYRI